MSLPTAGHVEVGGQAVSIALVLRDGRVVAVVGGEPTFAFPITTVTDDGLGPARGTIEYVEILERRIKTQRDQLDALNRAMRESQSNRATRKRIAVLERMVGVREFQLQRHRDAVVALNRKLAALEDR